MSHKIRRAQHRCASARLFLPACVCIAVLALPAQAKQVDITPPAGAGVAFGSTVTVLPNGNIVVTDPSGPTSNIGAVYLYSPSGTQISVLTGSNSNDFVGGDGIKVVGDSNFVVISQHWSNGAATGAGAVTWVNGTTGLSGVVSSSNSLVGTVTEDYVGARGVTVLGNGDYVVVSPFWSNGAMSDVGAVTFGHGNSELFGAVSSSNSLIGSSTGDAVGYGGITPLSNGNYVVASPGWKNGTAINAGAATWVNVAQGLVGPVTSGNSLVGSTASDFVGTRITALSNGNYVVCSSNWSNGVSANAGAVTWVDGSLGLFGSITPSNSLVGAAANDLVGYPGATALKNGNYVVASLFWNNGSTSHVGAVTWGDGSTGVSGPLSSSNSLIGGTANDTIGNDGILALSNGNYVIMSPQWSNGVNAGAGAATWANGATMLTGSISPSNSLIGTSPGDTIGIYGVALNNGNYVTMSANWHNGSAMNAGAATWGSGTGGVSGPVTSLNSLIGVTASDAIGSTVVALNNGNYVVASSTWNNGAATLAGEATWAAGGTGVHGPVTAVNSLIGGSSNDQVAFSGVTALSNGKYVVASSDWSNGSTSMTGAVTVPRGNTGVAGLISASNSLVGTHSNDQVGVGLTAAEADGTYVVASPNWSNGLFTATGAVTLASSQFRLTGTIHAWNSVLGTASNRGYQMNYAYDATRHVLVVGRPGDNTVSLFTMDQVFADNFEP